MSQFRCPVCCAGFDGQRGTRAFDAFLAANQTCKGQQIGDCACEWERLCDGTTLLNRSSDPCPRCAIEFPDGSCAKCPGCLECQPAPLSPLVLQVEAGLEDDRLLHHLKELERFEAVSARGLSEGEKRLKDLVWRRLEQVTRT